MVNQPQQNDEFYCSNCNSTISHDDKICPNCGIDLTKSDWFCPNCDAAVSENDAVCSRCGADLSDSDNPPSLSGDISKKESNDFISDYFSFTKMITPELVAVIYFIGVILIIGGSVVMIVWLDDFLLQGIGIIIFGNILWRVICESIIVIYKIFNALISIEKKL